MAGGDGGEDVIVKPEFMLVRENSTNNDTKNKEEGNNSNNKSRKGKGRNKDRPPPVKFDRASKLCPILVDIPEDTKEAPRCQFPNCAFQHDVGKYLETRKTPEEMGMEVTDKCPVFDKLGKCARGATCIFYKAHVVLGEDGVARNKVDAEKVKKVGKEESNHLEKELQQKLWKKKIDFKKVDEIVDRAYKNREESLKTKEEIDPPPQKMVKIEVEETVEDKEPVKKIDWTDKLYLAPLTTVGNLPFRRICKKFGVDVTCGEMAMGLQLLQGHKPEWALVQRHQSEDLFGVQLCGSNPHQMTRAARLIEDHVDCDFVDINLGCPIDLVYKQGMGSGLMVRRKPLEVMVRSMAEVMTRPLTVKMRTGVYADKSIAHELIPRVGEWGATMVTLHGRSREQRYTRSADWSYVARCVEAAGDLPICGNGDVMNFEDYQKQKEMSKCKAVMIARGALIKPWIFTEIKESRHWDISATERMDMVKDYANYGLEHWGSDDKGVETTRRFLLEWLSFLHRYVPHGLLERPPQKINQRLPCYRGRGDAETLLSSPICSDWFKITEMFLGKVPEGFRFEPKHRAHAYKSN